MINPDQALSAVPDGLRRPLLQEYSTIVSNYFEHRWGPAELSSGKFCEIVYSIIDGYSKSSYPKAPSKPKNMVEACRKLEQASHMPRSFQILIPRMLPALYEIRNNRGVGHAGGDVDPNHMDASVTLSLCSWIMGELIRVFHATTTEEAQTLVDSMVERRIPLVWASGDTKRVLALGLSYPEQILLLLAASSGKAAANDLLKWTEMKSKQHFQLSLNRLHKDRKIEVSADRTIVRLLPSGSAQIEEIVRKSKKPKTTAKKRRQR